MTTDHETTTPEAAAQYEADRTPYYDERWDRYEPGLGPRRQSDDSCEWDDAIHEAALRADALLRGLSWRRA